MTRPDRLWDALASAAADSPDCGSLHLVGGPVRDALLGASLERITDLDTVVEGDAVSVAGLLHGRLGGELVVHERFRTATWRPEGGAVSVDLITARRERYAHPGALPDVEAADLEADLRRRDFTVNAIARRLWPEPRWELVDPLGGGADLAQGLLRILHDRSFIDDPTRILRLARFAVRLELREEPSTRRALDLALRRDDPFAGVSGERLMGEWERVCAEPDPPGTTRWLLARGVAAPLGLDAGGASGQATLLRLWEAHLRDGGPWDPELALAALLSGGSVERAASRLGLEGRARQGLAALTEVAGLARVLLGNLDPVAIDERLERTTRRSRRLMEASCPETTEAIRWYEREVVGCPMPVDGDDLVRAGVAEGPAVGEALRRVRRAWLLDEVTDRAGALALLGLSPEDCR